MNTHEHASAAKPPSTMAPHAPFQAKLHPPSTSSSEHKPSAKTPWSRQHQPLKRHQPTKNVTFASQSKGRIIPNLQDYTNREKRRLWQTPEDKKANQVEVAHIVRTVRRHRRNFLAMSLSSTGNQPDDNHDDICVRGLEHFCCKATFRNQVRRREALVDDVFYCQNSQWQAGNLHANDELLRRVSIVHSQADVDRAILLAAQDEIVVKTMLQKEGWGGQSQQVHRKG